MTLTTDVLQICDALADDMKKYRNVRNSADWLLYDALSIPHALFRTVWFHPYVLICVHFENLKDMFIYNTYFLYLFHILHNYTNA